MVQLEGRRFLHIYWSYNVLVHHGHPLAPLCNPSFDCPYLDTFLFLGQLSRFVARRIIPTYVAHVIVHGQLVQILRRPCVRRIFLHLPLLCHSPPSTRLFPPPPDHANAFEISQPLPTSNRLYLSTIFKHANVIKHDGFFRN